MCAARVPRGRVTALRRLGASDFAALQDGQIHGDGSLVYPNGERYEGQWVQGKRHGRGAYHYADGGRYEGEWVDDKIHGRGQSHYANGNVYDGEVRGQARAGRLGTNARPLPAAPIPPSGQAYTSASRARALVRARVLGHAQRARAPFSAYSVGAT